MLTGNDRIAAGFVVDLLTRDELRAKLMDICAMAQALCYRSARCKISPQTAGEEIAELMHQLQNVWEDMHGEEHDRMDDFVAADRYWFADPQDPTDEFEGFYIARAAREALGCATTEFPGGWVDSNHHDDDEEAEVTCAGAHETGAGVC